MKKFIITQDNAVALKLIENGVKLVSNVNGIFTFINELPKKFSFSEADIKKVVYTDKLTF